MSKCKNCVVGLFGACGKDNAEYCRLERETLMDEARSLARERGHELQEFLHVDDYTVWEARCVLCGQVARIDLDPEPDASCLHGDALLTDCPEGQAVATSMPQTENDKGLWD